MPSDPRVDAYLRGLPAEQRELLQALRERVAALVPDAVETFSYQIPGFKFANRLLLSYAGWKRHCSVYPIRDDLLGRYEEALRGHVRTKGSLHFSLAQPLPDGLLDELVRARIATIAAGGR